MHREPVTIEEAEHIGYVRGRNFASGTDLQNPLFVEGEVESPNDIVAYLVEQALDAEMQARDFSPWGFTAARFNNDPDRADELWGVFDAGVYEGAVDEAQARVAKAVGDRYEWGAPDSLVRKVQDMLLFEAADDSQFYDRPECPGFLPPSVLSVLGNYKGSIGKPADYDENKHAFKEPCVYLEFKLLHSLDPATLVQSAFDGRPVALWFVNSDDKQRLAEFVIAK